MAEAKKKSALGPTGKAVADNIKRLRGDMQYVKLADRLKQLGRPIPTLGLRKIESYERRVDADDLVALAVALGVSPISLLVPLDSFLEDDSVEVTGVDGGVAAKQAWEWMRGETPLRSGDNAVELLQYIGRSAPGWRVRNYANGVQALLELNRVERDMQSSDPVVAATAKVRFNEMVEESRRGDD